MANIVQIYTGMNEGDKMLTVIPIVVYPRT